MRTIETLTCPYCAAVWRYRWPDDPAPLLGGSVIQVGCLKCHRAWCEYREQACSEFGPDPTAPVLARLSPSVETQRARYDRSHLVHRIGVAGRARVCFDRLLSAIGELTHLVTGGPRRSPTPL
jgi:hypothetical protein